MLIAIDPDVFVASLTDSSCEHMLEQVFHNLERLRVAVDDSQEILSEYYAFLDKHIDTYEEHTAIKLLQEVLFVEEQVILPLPTQLPLSLRDALKGYEYTTIEEKLLRMVANAEHLGLRLLLAGTGINARLRPRKLNESRVRRRLEKKMPWLDVRFASDRREILKLPSALHCNARLFEFMAARLLQTQHPNLRCIETPDEVKEEIDLYGYEQDGDTLTVWVGECKQRQEGQEKRKPITIQEIEQLRRKMKVASQYEKSRSDLAGKTIKPASAASVPIQPASAASVPIQIKGLIISNATEFFDDLAVQEAQRIGAEFWHAELTSGWTNNQHWYIHQLTRKL